MAQALKEDFPEVESAVSITRLYAAGLTRETHSLRNAKRDTRYDENNILAVDTTFFDVFLSYQISIRPVVFVVSGLGLVLIAWVTLSYFTIKASRLNPAETLKNE